MDKRDLLGQLRIDRDAPPERSARPLKWLIGLAVLGGLAFVGWFVVLPAEKHSALLVPTAVAAPSTAARVGGSVLDATGYVVARRQATVSAKVTGKVAQVLFEEGMTVSEGQLLATLDDSVPRAELALAQSRLAAVRAGLAELEAELRQAELDRDRTGELAAKRLASQVELDQARLAVDVLRARMARTREEIAVAERTVAVQRQLVEDMQLRAPFAGVIVTKSAQPGEMISPISAGGGFTRTGICTIVDMDSLEVEVDVNEAYINRVQSGQPVAVTLNAYPDERIPAEVIAIIPTADRTKATVRVRVGLLEKSPRVLPDMGVKVAFLETDAPAGEPAGPQGVLVPREALAEDARGAFVWVVVDGTLQRRAVTVAERRGSRVLLSRGLAGGERVVAPLEEALLASMAEGRPVSVRN
ncbi:MAG TPA: efflux RND transporter periplasmic adaptor subunit [Pseudomonadales bacterium]